MTGHVVIVGPRHRAPEGARVISTVSTGRDPLWRQLSPFYLGPVRLWGDHVSRNVENAWQYSKLYPSQTPTSWLTWAQRGWSSERAVRYPMGKGAVPTCSMWDGERLGYVRARAKIYVPLYARTVAKTEAFQELRRIHRSNEDLYLWDYDGWDYEAEGYSLIQVLTEEKRKMGHAFVLAMMLTWGSDFYRA